MIHSERGYPTIFAALVNGLKALRIVSASSYIANANAHTNTHIYTSAHVHTHTHTRAHTHTRTHTHTQTHIFCLVCGHTTTFAFYFHQQSTLPNQYASLNTRPDNKLSQQSRHKCGALGEFKCFKSMLSPKLFRHVYWKVAARLLLYISAQCSETATTL